MVWVGRIRFGGKRKTGSEEPVVQVYGSGFEVFM